MHVRITTAYRPSKRSMAAILDLHIQMHVCGKFHACMIKCTHISPFCWTMGLEVNIVFVIAVSVTVGALALGCHIIYTVGLLF